MKPIYQQAAEQFRPSITLSVLDDARQQGMIDDTTRSLILMAARQDMATAFASEPDGWALIKAKPTEEMLNAAKDAYQPFGEMEIALLAAISASPKAVKGGY